MKAIYTYLETTKQAFHQKLNRWLASQSLSLWVNKIVADLRNEHPRMSVRTMWYLLKPEGIGRDRFEAIARDAGYTVPRKRTFMKTTNSLGVTRFKNLIQDVELTHVNQVWVSDITYYRLFEEFTYITLIMDLYSRFIVGWSLAEDLRTTSTTIPALNRALRYRGVTSYHKELILHSDGGGQFYSKELLKITKRSEIRNSMAYNVYENAHAERVIGTIKNDYLIPYGPKTLRELQDSIPRAINRYNMSRPHASLNQMTPYEVELLSTSQVLV